MRQSSWIVWASIVGVAGITVLGSGAGCSSSNTASTIDASGGIDVTPAGTVDAHAGDAPAVDAAPAADTNAVADAAPSRDGSGPADASCSPGGPYGGGETSMAGATVTATIVDETGAPVSGQPAFICGLDLCASPGMSQATGAVSLHTGLTMKKPAFKIGDAVTYAELAIPLTMSTTDFTAGGTAVINTAKLAGKPGAPLTPGTNAVSGDVMLSIPAGAAVSIDTLVYDTPDKQQLRAVSIPMANEGPVLASAGVSGFGLLYGLAPAETLVCPPVKVSVALPHATMTPNDLGWAPGSAVEFWVMTTDTGQTYAPYAGWAKMSDGVVSADGRSVTTVDGQGFNFLETFAIRKAP
jgi:hypothetical protein